MSAIMDDVQTGLRELGLTGLQPDQFVNRMNALVGDDLQIDRDDFQSFIAAGMPTAGDGSVDLPTMGAWLVRELRERRAR